MKWFRLYDDLVYNAKAQSLPPKLFKAWVNLMCLASRNTPRGELPSIDQIAFGLRTNSDSAVAILEDLRERHFTEKVTQNSAEVWLIYGWTERQRESDNVAVRVERHRNKKLDENVTLPKRYGNALDTDTDTDTEEKRTIPMVPNGTARVEKYSVEFETFWKSSTCRGSKVDAYTCWRKIKPPPDLQIQILNGMQNWKSSEQWLDETKQPHVHRWLKRRGWEEIVPVSNGNGHGRKPTAEEIEAHRLEVFGPRKGTR